MSHEFVRGARRVERGEDDLVCRTRDAARPRLQNIITIVNNDALSESTLNSTGRPYLLLNPTPQKKGTEVILAVFQFRNRVLADHMSMGA